MRTPEPDRSFGHGEPLQRTLLDAAKPEAQTGSITCGDWTDTMAAAGAEEAQLVLTDPPYAISRKSSFVNGGVERFRVSMDFGDWDWSEIDLHAFAAAAFRTLKPGGTLIIFYDLWKITGLADAIRGADFTKLRFLEWVKTNPVPLNSRVGYLSNAREVAVCASKGPGGVFNSSDDNGIYCFPIQQPRTHPTLKPLSLFAELVRKHANPGDLVVDPFLGSGTTAEAALREGRRFLGGDADGKCVGLARERVRQWL